MILMVKRVLNSHKSRHALDLIWIDVFYERFFYGRTLMKPKALRYL